MIEGQKITDGEVLWEVVKFFDVENDVDSLISGQVTALSDSIDSKLGLRKSSTLYEVGDRVKIGQDPFIYLECVQAGLSKNESIYIDKTYIGSIVEDGDVEEGQTGEPTEPGGGGEDPGGGGEDPGTESDGGEDPGSGTESGEDEPEFPVDPEDIDEPGGDEPGTGGTEPGGDEPGGGEDPGSGTEPGGDEPGSDDEPGTGGTEPGGDEPGGGEDPGTEPGGDEPGSGDEPGGDEPGSGTEPGGDEPGGDEPGGGEDPGSGTEPGGDEPGGNTEEPTITTPVKWLVLDTTDGTPLGGVRSSLYVLPGYVVANGSTVNREDYPRLVRYITENNLWTQDSTAFPGLYGVGDGTTTMVLPDLRGLVVQFSESDLGEKINPGLPNITGSITNTYGNLIEGTDAISTSGEEIAKSGNASIIETESTYSLEETTSTGLATLTFNASNSNALYGASETVQPAAVKMLPLIRY